MRATLVAALAALALSLAPAASAAHRAPHAPAAAGKRGGQALVCPKAWMKGWVALADKINAPVYCPTWMPQPLNGKIGGQWQDIYAIGKDRSYLISFLYHGDLGTGDVHVNFRGYPGRTKIPMCKTIVLAGKNKTLHGTTPCFADPHGTVTANGIKATVYTVNQDADQWHVLFLWRYRHSIYTVSEHVIKPYTYEQVVQHLDKLLRTIVLVDPST